MKTIFPSRSLPLVSFPSPSHQTLDGTQCPDHHRSMAPRGYRVCVCAFVCIRCVCVSQFRGPRPRICCGSVQWTGARQDVTFWRKLSQSNRPSSDQSTPFVPPSTNHLKHTGGFGTMATLFYSSFICTTKLESSCSISRLQQCLDM